MTRRLGASVDTRFGVGFERFVAHLDALGLNHVEVTTEYLEAHPDPPTPAEVRDLTDQFGMTVTYHAPFRDWNLGSFNDASARAGVEQVMDTLDAAAAAGAGAVVVHGGSVPERYPEWVRESARENAVASLRRCAHHAADLGVPLCLENQPRHDRRVRHTTDPATLAETLAAVGVGPEALKVTLDVGHATVNDTDWRDHVARFGDRIEVVHLHDNDGTADRHEPLPDYEGVVEAVDAPYNVFEMKSVADLGTCLGSDADGAALDGVTP